MAVHEIEIDVADSFEQRGFELKLVMPSQTGLFGISIPVVETNSTTIELVTSRLVVGII